METDNKRAPIPTHDLIPALFVPWHSDLRCGVEVHSHAPLSSEPQGWLVVAQNVDGSFLLPAYVE